MKYKIGLQTLTLVLSHSFPSWLAGSAAAASSAAFASASASAPLHSLMLADVALAAAATDENGVHDPCSDTRIQRGDGFNFGIAFASVGVFYSGGSVQLSPCDRRLSLASSGQLVVFRPKVDIFGQVITTTTTSFNPVSHPHLLLPCTHLMGVGYFGWVGGFGGVCAVEKVARLLPITLGQFSSDRDDELDFLKS
uniref:Xylanase inhibitor N-terminal domain-containing protein n=1 Tax=Oryza rufipogon TaxID=4529 RepID=A0A0E0QJ67_ORYRU